MKFTVVTGLVGRIEERFNKFVKKFAKYGKDVITFEKSDSYYSDEQKCYVTDIDIQGSYKVEGYEFIGTLEYIDSENCNLIKKINPDIEVPEKYRISTECDHCKTKRFRKNTVLLRNIETGEFIQVGKACVKDYLGVDVVDYARYISWFKTMEDYIESTIRPLESSYRKPVYSVEEILLQTAERVREFGYISKAQANAAWYDESRHLDTTSSVLFHMMIESVDGYGKIIYPKYEITDYAREYVKSAIDCINNMEETDYIYNLKTLLKVENIESDKIGMVVSLIGIYIRELYKNEEKKRIAASTSKHIGAIGDKIQFVGKPELLTSYDTDFGVTRIYKFVVDGDEIIWKTGNYLDPNIAITLKGTVKEHSSFKNVPQTILTRCRVCK